MYSPHFFREEEKKMMGVTLVLLLTITNLVHWCAWITYKRCHVLFQATFKALLLKVKSSLLQFVKYTLCQVTKQMKL